MENQNLDLKYCIFAWKLANVLLPPLFSSMCSIGYRSYSTSLESSKLLSHLILMFMAPLLRCVSYTNYYNFHSTCLKADGFFAMVVMDVPWSIDFLVLYPFWSQGLLRSLWRKRRRRKKKKVKKVIHPFWSKNTKVLWFYRMWLIGEISH